MAYRRKCSRQRSIVCLSRELSASFDFCYAAIVHLLHFSTALEIAIVIAGCVHEANFATMPSSVQEATR